MEAKSQGIKGYLRNILEDFRGNKLKYLKKCLRILKTMDDEEQQERARRVQAGRKYAEMMKNMNTEELRRYIERENAKRAGAGCNLERCKKHHTGEEKRDPYACVRYRDNGNGTFEYYCSITGITLLPGQEAEGPERLAELQKRYGEMAANADNASTFQDYDWKPKTYDYPPWFHSHVDQNACYVEGQKSSASRTPRQQAHHDFMEAIGNHTHLVKYAGFHVQRLLYKIWPENEGSRDGEELIRDYMSNKHVIIAAAVFYTAKHLGILGWIEPPTLEGRRPHPACLMIDGHAPRFGMDNNLACLKRLLPHHIHFAKCTPNREQRWLIQDMGAIGPPHVPLQRIRWIWRKYVTDSQFEELKSRFSSLDAIKAEFMQFEFSPEANDEETSQKANRKAARKAVKAAMKANRKAHSNAARKAADDERNERRANKVANRLRYPRNIDTFIKKYLPEEWPYEDRMEVQRRWLEINFSYADYKVVWVQFKDSLARTYSSLDQIPLDKRPTQLHGGLSAKKVDGVIQLPIVPAEFQKLHQAWKLIESGERDPSEVEQPLRYWFKGCLLRFLVETPVPLNEVPHSLQKNYKRHLKKKMLRVDASPKDVPEWMHDEYEQQRQRRKITWRTQLFPEWFEEGMKPDSRVERCMREDYRVYFNQHAQSIATQRQEDNHVEAKRSLEQIEQQRQYEEDEKKFKEYMERRNQPPPRRGGEQSFASILEQFGFGR